MGGSLFGASDYSWHVILSNAKDLLFYGGESRSFALLRTTCEWSSRQKPLPACPLAGYAWNAALCLALARGHPVSPMLSSFYAFRYSAFRRLRYHGK